MNSTPSRTSSSTASFWLLLLALATALLLSVPGSAPAATDESLSQTAIRDSDPDARRALELAMRDDRVRARLSLRPGPYSTRASRINVAGSEEPSPYVAIEWYQDDEWRFVAQVDVERGTVLAVSGQALNVMPGQSPRSAFAILGDLPALPASLAVFIACLVFGPRTRWYRTWVSTPLAIGAVATTWTLSWTLDGQWLRAGSIVQYGAPVAALSAAAVAWCLAARRGDVNIGTARGWAWPWYIVIAGALALQAWAGSRVKLPIDVAFASDAGARLMRGGVRVYGNILEVPGFLIHGDTYGPIAYLAYVPGSLLFEQTRTSVLATNLAIAAFVAIALLTLGARHGRAREGAWAAAAWAAAPMVLVATTAGHNDMVVAGAVMATVLVMHSPALRGVLVAVAMSTKLLPVLLLGSMLRTRGENARIWRVVIGTFLLTGTLVWLVGLRDLDGLREFGDGIRYQLDRDDIASVWGLSGTGQLRLVVMAGAIVSVVMAARWAPRTNRVGVLLLAAAPLALALAAMPQFWFSYVTWVMPLVLSVPLVSRDSTR